MDPILARYQELEDHISSYMPNLDKKKLYDAFTYADTHHHGQLRKSGEPYIIHPLAVAEIVADLELDLDSIIAALLHDCIEDTDATHAEIAKKFGEPVAALVEGVTKLTRVHFVTKEEEQMENLRKMLMAMSKDIRVILIKICDRLHNMRTMEYQSPKKQREKSHETMQIYAPLAHRLGMQNLKWELEDLSLQYLDPIAYKEIQQDLEQRSSTHEEFLASIQHKIQDKLEKLGIKCTVYGRVKHIYSIYRKMYAQHKTLDEIFDLYAYRDIVDSKYVGDTREEKEASYGDCYNVLGWIHDMFTPVPGRFKDYIGTPKPNGYQSLHTTVIGREAIPFEVQIRTAKMHQVAEYGVAAHWKYKQGLNGKKPLGTEADFEWVRKLLENQQDTDAEEFVSTLKVDMFADECFVFTPQGDVRSLPAGANPIDFAYCIHSAVGNSMVGAKVNGRIVPYDTELHNGDIVEIITSKSSKGPNRNWLNMVKSNEARNKIRQWFKREKREENVDNGRLSFELELRKAKIKLDDVTNPENLPHILHKFKLSSLDDLYASIGYGGTPVIKAVARVREELLRLEKARQDKLDKAVAQSLAPTEAMSFPGMKAPVESAEPLKPQRCHSESGIVVSGLGDCTVKFAKCCTPVPGDPVVGFITRGYGVSVHRCDCVNAIEENRKSNELDRWLPVSWAAECPNKTFAAAVTVDAENRDGLAMAIMTTLSNAKVEATDMSAHALPGKRASIHLTLRVKNNAELKNIMNKLNGIQGVSTVIRPSTI